VTSTTAPAANVRRAGAAALWVAALIFSAPALAADMSPGEAASRRLAERAFTDKPIDAFRKLPDLPFYEIWIDRTLVYTDLDGKVLILGNMLEAKTLTNLRQTRLNELLAIPFKDLPLEGAIKTVQGRGHNKLVVFADPYCQYCKRFETELKAVKDVTIYTVMYPVLGPDSLDKARAILCAPKPAIAWHAWMDSGIAPPAPAASCKPSFDSILAFGRKNDIAVTPTTFFESGKRLAGISPAATVNEGFAAPRR
jgi:thiol:disulfide interchange protein DsbC